MSAEDKYWWNFATGAVERGFESPAIDRAGPFDTPEEAAKAPELLRERARQWAEDDARDDDWPKGGKVSGDGDADGQGGAGR